MSVSVSQLIEMRIPSSARGLRSTEIPGYLPRADILMLVLERINVMVNGLITISAPL